MTTLEKLDVEIATLESRLDELRTAKRVLVGLEPPPEGDSWPNGRFKGANMYSWAMLVLTKLGRAHFRDIADEALRRGYNNKRDSSAESIHRSFWDTMRRDDDFKMVGNGYFELANPEQAQKEYSEFLA